MDIKQLHSLKSVQVELPGEGKKRKLMTFQGKTKVGQNAWFFYDEEQNVLTIKFQNGCLEISLKLAKDYAS